MSDVTEINVKTGQVKTRKYTQQELDARANAVIPESVLTVQESFEEQERMKQSALSKLEELGLTSEDIKALFS